MMETHTFKCLLALSALVQFVTDSSASSNIQLPEIDDSVAFSVRWKEPLIDIDEFTAKHQESLELVSMMTAEKEPYVCYVPKSRSSKDDDDQAVSYSGPTPLELLQSIFKKPFCVYRLEQYWTYELCHGKSLRQYHEESVVSKDEKKVSVQEYYLGRYDEAKFARDNAIYKRDQLADSVEGKKRKSKTIRLDGAEMPYFEVNMTDGTVCDINKKPRLTRVHYVCAEDAKHDILSLEEKSTCEYRVVVLTSLLCSHPHYRYELSTESAINCHPVRPKATETKTNAEDKKPEETSKEAAATSQPTVSTEENTAGGDRGETSKEVKQEFPVKPYDLEEIEEEDRQFRQAASDPLKTLRTYILQELKNQAAMNEANRQAAASRASEEERMMREGGDSTSSPTTTPRDPRLIEAFLSGRSCLTGGMGWWKYEFCYGRKVEQYHEERGKPRQTITLGKWDVAKHKEWIKANPERSVAKGKIPKVVSHFYSGGDVCDLTKEPRTVEVKLKCKELKGHPDAVTLYLLEPKPCSYVLGVDSTILCEILKDVDEFGIPRKPMTVKDSQE